MIDPAEALLAVIGVRPIISREVERVLRRDIREAGDMERTIARLARQVCRGELVEVAPGDFRYGAALRDLSEAYRPAQVEAMASKVPEDLRAPFVLKAAEVFKLLQAKLPRSVVSTIAGARNVVPDDLAVHQFVAELDALDDPLRVFPGMATASITRRQIQAVREVYPTISAAIDAALLDAVATEKAARKSWELPPLAEIGAGKWIGRPRVSPSLQGQIQQNYRRADKPPPAPDQKSKPSAIAKESLSPAQVTAFAGQASR